MKDFTDLFVVVALGSALYAVMVALTNQRQFLHRAVNPHRLTWLIASVSVLWVGLTLMRFEAQSWDLQVWGHLLSQLVSDEKTPARVKVAALALMFSAMSGFLVLWCVIFYPRDPSTFRRPSDRKAAFRYYVCRLRGGLDYAILALGDGDKLEEEANVRQITDWCPHLPKVKVGDNLPLVRTSENQIEYWRQMAMKLHSHMSSLDAEVEPARQGRNRGLIFDVEYGGMFFRYLRMHDPREQVDTGLFLFAATLSEEEMRSGRAGQHFQLLLDALHQIDRSIRAN